MVRRGVEARPTEAERGRELLEALPFGAHFYELRDDGRLVFIGANAASERILGVGCADLVGRTIEEAFPPLAETEVPERYRRTARDGIPWRTEQVDYRDGEIRGAFEVSTVQTAPGRMAALFTEITERKRAELSVQALLRTSAQVGADFFAAFVRELAQSFRCRFAFVGRLAAPGRVRTVAVWDRGGPGANFEYDLAGTPCENVVGRKVCSYPDGVQGQFPNDRALAKMGIRSYLGMPLASAAGKPLGLVAVLHDEPLSLTDAARDLMAIFASRAAAELERIQAGEALARERDLLRRTAETLDALIQASPVAIIAVDADLKVSLWNSAAERIFGWSAEEVLGRPNPIIPEARQGEFSDIQDRLGRGELVADLEVERQRKGGSPVQVSLSTAVLRGEDGAVHTVFGLFLDISERKLAEERLRQAQKMESVGRLAGGVAHDFNNLLTVILGYVDLLLRDHGLPAPAESRLRAIGQAAERAAGLTRQLLAFSRKQVVRPVLLDLRGAVEETSAMLRRLIGEDLELVCGPCDSPLWVRADEAQLAQVIMNLAVNARDAMPGGGTLTLETERKTLDEPAARRIPGGRAGDYALLRVSDTGVGMDQETLAHIFEPFYTTKEQGKGTGLGLATVYGIVTQTGGFLRVESAPGEGTTFEAFLPLAEDHAAQTQEAPGAVPGRGTGTILLVEDEDGLREFVAEVLLAQGFQILGAPGPEEAIGIEERTAGPIHLLLTDVVMPRLDGRELAARLRRKRPGLRVLYMSGYAAARGADSGADLAAADLLQKPFGMDELIRRVQAALRAPGP